MTSANDLEGRLVEKDALERQAIEAVDDAGKATALLRKLQHLNRTSVGTLAFRWPGHPHSLHLRCGSSDLSNFMQIFVAKEYDVRLPYAPARIIDLGGYVGFAAAYLANKFPDASIVSVEPSRDSHRVNILNTAPFNNVRRLNAAVWEKTGTLAVANSVGGDWGSTFSATGATGEEIPSYTLADLLAWAGWDRFDFLKCDIEGAEKEVFLEARDLIAANVDVCAVEIHGAGGPAEIAVNQCFEATLFERFKHGEFNYFVRRGAEEPVTGAARLSILKPSSGLRPIELVNVPEPLWGYYIFEGDSCQLHPADASAPKAMLKTQIRLSGQTSFESEVSVINPLGLPVVFSLMLNTLDGSQSVVSGDQVVVSGERARFGIKTKSLHGTFELTLATQMAQGTSTNHQAVANWHHPSFC